MSEWVTLRDLPAGSVFETKPENAFDLPVLAVKTEYSFSDNNQCVLLGSGLRPHFPAGNDTMVRAIDVGALLARVIELEGMIALMRNDSDAYQRGREDGAGGIVLPQGPCRWEGCFRPATAVVARCGHGAAVGAYCPGHAFVVATGGPVARCPNCHCEFGIDY